MKKLVFDKFKEYNISLKELERYNEPHRFYHNWDHINYMLTKANELDILTDNLLFAIVFHDIIYDLRADDNEEKSVQLFNKYYQNDIIEQAILDTKTHKPTNDISRLLCDLDLDVLYDNYERFVDYENKIFKEYQFVDYKIYKEKRLEILTNLGVNTEWLNYVKYRKPNIAVYSGSFNQFHKGHYDILKKSEDIFDKVIIARGINPEKNNRVTDLPTKIQNRQIENYDGLLTDFIEKLGYEVTLIRGLRNATDLQYELTQYRYLQDLYPKIKVVSIFCNKEYEHISSSAIRMLEKYDKSEKYLL